MIKLLRKNILFKIKLKKKVQGNIKGQVNKLFWTSYIFINRWQFFLIFIEKKIYKIGRILKLDKINRYNKLNFLLNYYLNEYIKRKNPKDAITI